MQNSDAADLLTVAAEDLWRLEERLNTDAGTDAVTGVRSLARIAEALRDSFRARPGANNVASVTMQNIESLAIALDSEVPSAPDEETAATLRSIAAQLRRAIERTET